MQGWGMVGPVSISRPNRCRNNWKWQYRLLLLHTERISSRNQGGDYFAFLKRIGYAEDKKYQAKIQNIINTRRP
jgi:hypothetical protein